MRLCGDMRHFFGLLVALRFDVVVAFCYRIWRQFFVVLTVIGYCFGLVGAQPLEFDW